MNRDELLEVIELYAQQNEEQAAMIAKLTSLCSKQVAEIAHLQNVLEYGAVIKA